MLDARSNAFETKAHALKTKVDSLETKVHALETKLDSLSAGRQHQLKRGETYLALASMAPSPRSGGTQTTTRINGTCRLDMKVNERHPRQ